MNWDTVVVMGVSGCGKTTVGEKVAARLGWHFIEGDRYHPKENIDKMSKGIPLDDTDRFPWLHSIREEINNHSTVVIACSSLKRIYRDILSKGRYCLFVFLDVDKNELIRRLSNRSSHFFPSSLLQSQLSTLERPSIDESSFIIPINGNENISSIEYKGEIEYKNDQQRGYNSFTCDNTTIGIT